MCKLSIIIPMYNSFKYMKKNLKILEKQINKNDFEVIIIDDCSSDTSFQDAKVYAKKTTLNISVYKNEKNLGPGVSRNEGIKYSSGDFITFIDSDDYVDSSFIVKIWRYLNEDIDCLIFDYALISENGSYISGGKSIGSKKITPGYIDNKEALVFVYGSTCGKIYRKKIIIDNNVRYGNLFRNEDMPFTKHALAKSSKIYYLAEELYYYVQVKTSLMHTEALMDEKNCQSGFDLLKKSIESDHLDVELESIELREVLNETVLIMIAKNLPLKKINDYVRKRYNKRYIKNKYFHMYPLYVKVVTILIYFRMYWIISLIWRYKKWKKQNQISF